ncbi:MAG: YjbH domain-containing protein [Verrucomicrobia bacterium]|nr:YjbH domain-containing protein [Verrucomicrobiota bacterium]
MKFLLLLCTVCLHAQSDLFQDLEQARQIDLEVKDQLPLFYNYSMMGGYFTMPSARMPKMGVIAGGAAYARPYTIYGVNFQMFDRVEMSANYRIYQGILEKNFGHEGFGDDAERIGNIKIGLLTPEDGYPTLPQIAIGAEDFIGTQRFNSEYAVMTKQFLHWNVEATLGWGRGRIKGWFGGAAWTPFRHTKIPLIKDLTLSAEYDAINYKKHLHEHPSGRKVSSRINAGLSLKAWDTLQLSVSSLRGREIAGSASLQYPIGSTKGLFPKVDDPGTYLSPVDTEPVGKLRSDRDLAHELAYAFSDQGLDLNRAYLDEKVLWLQIVNNRYREERVVRERIQHVLAALTPSNVEEVLVVIEADALPCQSYHYRREDLDKWRWGKMSDFELETLSPMREVFPEPSEYDVCRIFDRHKPIYTFTIRPQLLTFFGSASGKFKYALNAIASLEGYLLDQFLYKVQGSYALSSSLVHMSGRDRLNPSRLPIVRTDTLKYFQPQSFSLEQAFLQKGWNAGKGRFCRLALGYFESAYAGGALELLYYPTQSHFAIGFEFATVWKRHYHGLGLRGTTWQLKGNTYEKIPFVGIQYFLDLYYDFKPLNMDFLVSIGQFLAKDKGARFEIGRYFKSGIRFSLWCTVTNGNDHVNGHVYFDKGFAFIIPLDLFLKQSSRNYVGYAMAAWLRDVGARAMTGKKLYWTLEEERYSFRG